MAIASAGLSVLALFTGSASGRVPQALVPAPALSQELQARPEAQLLAGALRPLSSGGKPPAFIQVPPSPLSANTLQALQASSQQLSVREETIFELAASAPQRELERALASVTRPTSETTTRTIETPDTTVTRTISETITVPGEESAGAAELRQILEDAETRVSDAEDLGGTRFSDRYLSYLARSVERRGDRLLDELDRAVARGGEQLERRAERAIDRRGDDLVRAIDRLFDRGGDKGAAALDGLLEENGTRIVRTLASVLEATGENVSEALEDLLVKAGPRVIDALQSTLDDLRPTTTQTVTRQVTEIVPGTTQTVTETTTGTSATTSEVQQTPAEQRVAVRRQVEAYSSASKLLAPLVELSTPPDRVPNPAANSVREEREDERPLRGPIARDKEEREPSRTRASTREDVPEIPLRQPVAVERSGGSLARIEPLATESSTPPIADRIDVAA